MKKKIIAALLTFVLAVGSVVDPSGIETVRAEQVTEDGIQYTAGTDGIQITGYTGTAERLVIPDSIDGERVTSIGDNAFRFNTTLTGITLPSGLRMIWNFAFSGCSNLADIEFPENMPGMMSNAFEGTQWLEDQYLSNGKMAIINNVVIGADESISGNVTLPSGVKNIAVGAFANCTKLTGITLSPGMTGIASDVFVSCRGLTSITLPVEITFIAVSAFANCEQLKDVYYGGSESQWKEIEILSGNDCLTSARIHYNSTGIGDPNAGGSGGTVQKKVQTITAADITETYGAKAFFLGASSSVGAELSYTVSDSKVATVDGSGKVTIKGCGITDILIIAAETDAYSKAQKMIRLTVKPQKISVTSVKSKKKKTATVKWKRDKQASGYLVECATDKKFKKNKVRAEVKKSKTVVVTVKKLKPGKKYYVRVCAYAKAGNMKAQGDWSKAKAVKVKK